MPYYMEKIWLEGRFVLLTTSRADRPIGRSLAYGLSVCWLSFAPSPSILQVALPAIYHSMVMCIAVPTPVGSVTIEKHTCCT